MVRCFFLTVSLKKEEPVAARLIDGKALALQVRERLATESAAVLAKTGMRPGLATILVGDDPASHLYVKSKQKACDAAGIYIDDHKLPTNTTQAELLALIEKENADPKIHGILVQLPLPKHIDSKVVLEAVSPDKDADGFHPYNFGRLVEGHPVFEACTPKGVIKMVESTGVSIEGKRAVVLGRSNIVGKPLALMLLQRNATVTICHSKTKDLPGVCREAELLLVAIGKAKFVTADMVRDGAVVIDVGTNRLPDGKVVGDVDFEPVSQKAGWISPVPGGVGPMTIAMLLDNTVESAKRMAGMM
ncbi:MAG TPA: bifunctional methylenetetrahydrofolate dehydrogenase/methenyltetrahydrofolate cyclohydrolase FolD [Nitrospiraceae bacterium]|nr:bifunctional methylenetetrahydrofolate dehydrogenase/methenyltetrahydrofolate cyclohydrolase FolD [Nitrospiraceae bacterium]